VSPSDGRLPYFAYGANVHPGWLRRRIPDAELAGPGVLQGYSMAFRKRGRDGAARSDAFPSDDPAAALPGALYLLRAPDLGRLDAAGAGYRATRVEVAGASGVFDAVMLVADPTEIATGLVPWEWYVALIRAGAALLDLPAAHRRWLEAVPTTPDPDARRAALAHAVIAAGTAEPGLRD
jgi:gamma-glutamylcyclotransferase